MGSIEACKGVLNRLNPTQKGIFCAFIGFTAFSFADINAKWLTGHYSIFQVLFMDHAIASLALLALTPWFGGFKALLRTQKAKIHALRCLINIVLTMLLVYSFSILPLADIYTFIFAMPFFAALLGIVLYKEIPKKAEWIAIILGFIGVLLALQPGTSGFDPRLLWSVLCGVLVALLFGLSRSLQGENVISLGVWTLIGTVIVNGIITALNFTPIPPAHLGIFLMAGLFLAAGMIFTSLGFRMAPAAAVSPILYTEMIWALIFGLIIFGDIPGPWTMLGAAIIIGSGLYLIMAERRNGKNND